MNDLRPPVSGVARNPLIGLTPVDMKVVAPGTQLFELMPDGEIVLCRYNGEWVPYEDFSLRVQHGDVIEWHELPQSGNALRSVLTIAIIAFNWWNPYGWSAGALGAFSIGATVAVNLLLPPTGANANAGQTAGNVYTTSLQGNQARLNQPIWKVCGRRKVSPPFAGMPYQEFVNASGTDVDNKQYYYALFAATIGNADLESAMIGGTTVSHFQDVLVASALPPGTSSSTARPNVETSTVVGSQILDSGKYVGGFVACKPERTCNAIGIDIMASRGISQPMSWRVEARQVNDFGVPTTGWSVLGTQSRNGSTNTPQRWSYKYTLPSAYRPEVRIVRTDVKNTDPAALHELAWAGLRGYLAQTASLDAATTHYEVVMRASDQLSQYSQRDFSLILQAKCRTWSSDTGWGDEVFTRNPAWWALDLATSSTWGLGEPDDRVDLQGFADLAAICESRQDHFDHCFDTATPAWDALQMIARAARARCFRRNGVLTIVRDDLQTLPVTAFTSRNTQPDSMTVVETLPTREQADGFIIEYEDARTWQWTPIECPCPGVTTMVAPIRKRIEGITGPTHALREGLYEAAALLYRTRQVSCKTEMEGVLPAYMSPVTWQPDIVGYGQTGDVAFWDSTSLVMGLSEPPNWGSADLYLRLRRDDGSMTVQVKVSPGPSANDIVLPAVPDFPIVLDDGSRERPIFVLGPLVGGDELVKVVAILDGGKGNDGEQLYEVRGLIDDIRVHTADNAYLPGPGDIQDPIDTTPTVEESGELLIVSLSDHSPTAYNPGGYDVSATFTLGNTGVASQTLVNSVTGYVPSYPNEWMQFGPIETSTAALYECRATYTGAAIPGPTTGPFATPTPPSSGSAINTWLNLGTTRHWTLELLSADGPAVLGCQLTIEIRDVATHMVQASQTVNLVCQNFFNSDSSGG